MTEQEASMRNNARIAKLEAHIKEARIAELEAENKKLRDALQGLYSHTKNNYQICGLNYRAKRVLEDCWLARNDAQEALKGGDK